MFLTGSSALSFSGLFLSVLLKRVAGSIHFTLSFPPFRARPPVCPWSPVGVGPELGSHRVRRWLRLGEGLWRPRHLGVAAFAVLAAVLGLGYTFTVLRFSGGKQAMVVITGLHGH